MIDWDMPVDELELYHHGIKGQKWGVRRYQNEDGTLTEAGKKRQLDRLGKKGEVVLKKGSALMRVSTTQKTNAKSGSKLYVNPDKDEHEIYKLAIGARNTVEKGQAYVHKYIAKNDIVVPSVKTQTKMELDLVKDKDVRKELVDSLMKKGMSREEATKAVKPINQGMEYLKASPWLLTLPISPMMAPVVANMATEKRDRQLNLIRNSVGDVENKKLNKNFEESLSKSGYNAYRDLNDRRTMHMNKSIVVVNPDKNVKLEDAHKLTKQEYGQAYANAKIYANKKITKTVDIEDLQKDGEKAYENLKKQYVLQKHSKAEREKILKKFAKELE